MASLRKLPGKVIGGGALKPKRVQVICPACGQQVEAVATDGQVKGYCAVAEQYMDFPITQGIAVPMSSQASTDTGAHIGRHLTAETKAKLSAAQTGKHHTAETRAKLSAQIQAKGMIKEPGVWAPEQVLDSEYFFTELATREMRVQVMVKEDIT